MVDLSADKPRVRAVTFDLWETLLLEKNGWNFRRTSARCKNLAKVLYEFNVEISTDQFKLAFMKMTPWLERIWKTNREVTHLDQIQFIIKTASKNSVTIEEEWIGDLSAAYVSPLFEVAPYLNPDACEVLKWLRDRNKLIGLICNTGLTPGFGLREFLIREGVAKYFDVMLFSDEVGIRKPNSRIFQIATGRLQVKPYEVVHIGDNLKSDMWGAKNVGFRTIYFSTEVGRDKVAESDPASLVSISRKINNFTREQIVPDKIIQSLSLSMQAIEELDT